MSRYVVYNGQGSPVASYNTELDRIFGNGKAKEMAKLTAKHPISKDWKNNVDGRFELKEE